MSYSILVPAEVAERISRWDLPPYVRTLLYERLVAELGSSPTQHLRSAPGFPGRMLYNALIKDPRTPDFAYAFSFWVKYGADEKSLIVLDAYFIDRIQSDEP